MEEEKKEEVLFEDTKVTHPPHDDCKPSEESTECCCHGEQKDGCACHEHQKGHGNKKHNKKFEEQLKQLEAEKKQLQEKIQYAQAELINYRKRKEDEMHNALKFANQDLILEILPVMDNFERAIALDDNNLTDELSKFLAGFKMMYATLTEVLKKFGVEEIDAYQKPFDAVTMEALMTDHDEAYEDGIVLEVLLKGYRLKDRVIRPCSVKVNQKEGEDKHE